MHVKTLQQASAKAKAMRAKDRDMTCVLLGN